MACFTRLRLTPAPKRYCATAPRERRLPLQIHAAQSVVEFHEIMRRHGPTPIEWLREIGVLGADVDHRPRDFSRPSFVAALTDLQRPRRHCQLSRPWYARCVGGVAARVGRSFARLLCCP